MLQTLSDFKSYLSLKLFGPTVISVLGIDNAGKTTLLFLMTHHIGVPTINENGIHHIERKLALVDCTILNSMDPKPLKTRILPHPFTKADKILYVLDGADRDRLKEGLDWLEKVVECQVHKIPCCLVMTKSDKANPITIEEVQELLSFRLDSVFQIIIRVNKNDRQGFDELFEWLQQ